MNASMHTTPSADNPPPPIPSLPPPRFPFRLLLVAWLTVMMVTILVTLVLPEAFVSTARIKIMRDHIDLPIASESYLTAFFYDPYFLQTELEIIQSEIILAPVVEELNLNATWGKRYFDGAKLKTSETLQLLRGRLDLRPVPNTMLLEIRVMSENPSEAAALANRIAGSYQTWRGNQAHELAGASLQSLAQQIKELEFTIAQARDTLVALTNATGRNNAANPAPLTTPEKQKDLEDLIEVRRTLTRRMNLENIGHHQPRYGQVMLINRAVPGTKPIRPNKPLNIWLGVLAGGCLGLLLATLVYLLQRRVFYRQSGTAPSRQLAGLRTFLRFTIVLVVGVTVGYNCARPMSGSSLLLTQFLVFLGGIALAYVELVRTAAPPGQSPAASSLSQPGGPPA